MLLLLLRSINLSASRCPPFALQAENEMLEAEIRQLEDMSELRARLSAPQPDGVAEAKCGWESTHWWWGKAPPSKSSVEIVEPDDDWKQDGTSERMQA